MIFDEHECGRISQGRVFIYSYYQPNGRYLWCRKAGMGAIYCTVAFWYQRKWPLFNGDRLVDVGLVVWSLAGVIKALLQFRVPEIAPFLVLGKNSLSIHYRFAFDLGWKFPRFMLYVEIKGLCQGAKIIALERRKPGACANKKNKPPPTAHFLRAKKWAVLETAFGVSSACDKA